MTTSRAIPQADSSDPVNVDFLLAVFDPDSDDPIAQKISDVIRGIFTQKLEDRINAAATLDEAIDAVGDALALLSEFTYDDATNAFTFTLPDGEIKAPRAVTKGLFTQAIYDFLAARDKWVSYGINDAAQLHQILTDAAQMKVARLLFFDADVIETHQGVKYDHKRNTVGYALPGDSTATYLFSVPDTKIKHAGTTAELDALLVTHQTERTDLFVFINAAFAHSGINYARGTLVSFRPESVAPTVEWRLPVRSTSIRIEPPSIAAPADLNRDYVLFLGKPDYTNAEVDELEIWFKEEAVHEIAGFKPEDGPFVISFAVDTTEETQVGLQGADTHIPVLAVYRKGGQYVGQDTTALAVQNQVPAPSGGKELTDEQKAELIGLRLQPSVAAPSDTAFKTWKVRSADPGILGASVWVQITVQGQTLARQQLTGAVLTFTFSDLIAEAINGNLASGAEVLTVELALHDAKSDGNLLATIRRDVTIRKQRVVQAPVDAGDTAGVTSIVLPADYAIYHRLAFVIWSPQNSVLMEAELHTEMLAAQTGNRNINVANRSNQGVAQVGWNSGTRTLSAPSSGNSRLRIIYAVLED